MIEQYNRVIIILIIMLNLSIKNIFEFLDKKIDGVKENLLKNIGKYEFIYLD